MSAEDRLTIDVELGATVPVGQFGNVRPLLRIRGLDPAGDVAAQVALALGAGQTAWALIDDELEVVISQMVAPDAGTPGFRDRVDALEQYRETARTNFKKIAERLKAMEGRLPAAVAERAAEDGG